MDGMDADLVVIGAGALGLSTALHAALLGQSVIVVDRYAAGSQASGRAAGLFKSVQADELRTRLARRSIELALTFADWAGVGLAVARSGSFLVARTPEHAAYLRSEARQSAGWGADVREAAPGQLASAASCYDGDASTELALWCPEDIYIEEPVSLIRAYLAAARLRGVEVARVRGGHRYHRLRRTGHRGRDGEALHLRQGRGGCRRCLDPAGRRAGRRGGGARAGPPSASDYRAVG